MEKFQITYHNKNTCLYLVVVHKHILNNFEGINMIENSLY